MRLTVHGSRTLSDERVRIIILEAIVTHGEPEGVCALARKIAQERAIPLTLHFLNFRFLRGAFEHRSKAVLRDGDFALFIHDGQSRGTQHELRLAEKMGLPHACHVLPPTQFKASVGFPVVDDWSLDDAFERINAELNAMPDIPIPDVEIVLPDSGGKTARRAGERKRKEKGQ